MPCTPERVYKAIRASVGTGDATASDVSALGGDAPREGPGQPHFVAGAEEKTAPRGARNPAKQRQGGERGGQGTPRPLITSPPPTSRGRCPRWCRAGGR